MKWLIASDIHGSAECCKKLMEAYDREGAEKLILLGDILYHGSRSRLLDDRERMQVMEMLNARKGEILCVRGNCDTEADQMVLEFPLMADYVLLTEGECVIFATHGHLYNSGHLPPLHHVNVLLHGHTHVPACRKFEDHVYLNPGSVSIPRKGSEHSYMTFDGRQFEWKNLEGECYHTFVVE